MGLSGGGGNPRAQMVPIRIRAFSEFLSAAFIFPNGKSIDKPCKRCAGSVIAWRPNAIIHGP
jgi:hypothetical protein